MIEIKNISKKFGKHTVLKNLSINFDDAGIYMILGPNGSGKTTLIKSILGMVIPNSGHIFFEDHSIKKDHLYRNKISYLPQTPHFPSNLSLKELINMIQDLKPCFSDPIRLINLFGLESFLSQKLAYLSGGTKQKVNILLAFMFDSPVFILDEPSVGLDPIALINLKKIILEEKAKNKLILITTHIISLVEYLADNLIFLLDGTLYYKGNITDLKDKTRKQNLEEAIVTIYQEHVF